LLVALAVYDLVAVLAPGGPLKLLVELASSRDDELPALVYEARPVVSRSRGSNLGLLVGGVSDSGSVELQAVNESENHRPTTNEGESLPLVSHSRERHSFSSESSEQSTVVVSCDRVQNREPEIVVDEEMSPLVEMMGLGNEREQQTRRDNVEVHGGGSDRGIKLGLGDFVFYSVLVGRAAMYDLMTVYACYLAIISGLGCTLILLSVCHRALPALPISIALGVVFYFLTRLLMEPFVVGTATNLMMF